MRMLISRISKDRPLHSLLRKNINWQSLSKVHLGNLHQNSLKGTFPPPSHYICSISSWRNNRGHGQRKIQGCLLQYSKSWKQPNVQQYGNSFSKLHPYAIIQNNFVEVCLQQALLVACLISFPLFFYVNRTQNCSGQRCSLLQAQNHDNLVPTFPASPAPRDGPVIQFGTFKYKGKSTGDSWESFCIPDEKDRYCWRQQSPTAALLLSESDSYLWSKGRWVFCCWESKATLAMVDSVMCRSDTPWGLPAIGSATGCRYLQELYSVEVSCLAQFHAPLGEGGSPHLTSGESKGPGFFLQFKTFQGPLNKVGALVALAPLPSLPSCLILPTSFPSPYMLILKALPSKLPACRSLSLFPGKHHAQHYWHIYSHEKMFKIYC